jgi:hypothetical protein
VKAPAPLSYRVERLGRDGHPPQNYTYAIWRGDERVAEYGHDFRNDERWLVIGGKTSTVSVDPLEGGGSQPLVVSQAGVKLLDGLLRS